MIRVVPVMYFLEDYENEKPSHMAFLDTVTDQFIMFDGTHVWECWLDLVNSGADDAFLERVRGLCPDWFGENER